ncbi:MAG: nucleoside phosphorylase [Erysipelotrichaceae bacterium]|nr:nucleoside phosphorylase [Erysipelotrichaceae bacterium]
MKEAHIQLDASVNAKCAVLPGDPKRVDVIASLLEDVQPLTFNREYRSVVGTYKGMRVIAISTGMGGSSTAIAVEELKHIGVNTMVRIGSCGAYQEGIDLGDLVLVEGAIREDGASKCYVDSIYPACPDYRLIGKCEEAAKAFGFPYHTGIALSHESFYHDENDRQTEYWRKKGVLGADFESAALFTVGRLRHVHTASILNNVVVYGVDSADAVADYAGGASKTAEGERREALVALEAMYLLQKEL